MARCQAVLGVDHQPLRPSETRVKPGIVLGGYDGYGGFDVDITMVMMVVMIKEWL